MDNVFVAGFRVSRKDAPRFMAVGDNVLLSVRPIDDSMAECGFLNEELEVMTKMAARVMVHEEPAEQIFTFDEKTEEVEQFVDLNADVKPQFKKIEGPGPPESNKLLSDQLEVTSPCLVVPQLEYNSCQPDLTRRKLSNFYGAASASIREDNFADMVHDEYLAQLAYDSSTDLQLFELSAIVKSVHKSNYPLSGEPGCVIGVMVTHYNKPEENNKGVLFRTMLKSNFPGISKPRLYKF